MSNAWRDWWKSRGEEHLTLLLWAVWDPVGPAPLDAYESYAPSVARILREMVAEDRRIWQGQADLDDAIQRRRNELWAGAVERLATYLAAVRRDDMELEADADADRRAAETLLEWYEWETPDE